MNSKLLGSLCAAITLFAATSANAQRARQLPESASSSPSLSATYTSPQQNFDDGSISSLPPGVSCPKLAPATNGSTSGNFRGPISNFKWGRCVYLVTAAELTAAGYVNGTIPTTIGWSYQVGNEVGNSAQMNVYLENTADTVNNKSTTWATAITGMTLVHSGVVALPTTAGPFDLTMTGGSPFTYTGGGIYVAVDWGEYAVTTPGVAAVLWCTNSLANGNKTAQSNASAPTTLASTPFRPETRLNGVPVASNDAAVSAVYALGSLAPCRVGPQAIRAVITNTGFDPQTNLQVTLNITGANPFSDTQTIPSLAGCGGRTTVTFLAYSPAVIGANSMTVSIPADDVNTNNSINKPTASTTQNLSYKYPGTTADGGVGLNGLSGAFVAKFTTTVADAISEVNLEFPVTPVPLTTYRVAIYADSGSGTPAPGAPLYLDAADRTILATGPVTITLPAPVAVAAGNFYVGIHQTNTVNAGLSFDTESPIRTGTFYFATALPVATWIDLAPNNQFKLNVGLTLQTGCPPPPPTGSCCVGVNCTIETAANCATLSGTYGGDGSTCTPDPCGPSCTADIDPIDGNVNTDDLLMLLGTWGTPCAGGCQGDVDGNGNVNSDDLLEMFDQWGTPCVP